MRLILLINLILSLGLFEIFNTTHANGKTINVSSCSQSDVQKAIDAANDQDTIFVPAGNCIYTKPVIVPNTKGITISGAGIDKTVIIDQTGNAFLESAFRINSAKGKPFIISGFTFDGAFGNSSYGAVAITGTCDNFRINNCRFMNLVNRGIWVQDYTQGVIDHCRFETLNDGTCQGISIKADGDAAWQRPLTLGTDKAVFVEDCTFNYAYRNDGALDAYNGARYVFRHNTVINTQVGHHGFDSGNYRSTHSFEIYNNSFTWNRSDNSHVALGSRGGTGVVYNNTINGNYDIAFKIMYYRSCCCDKCNETTYGYPCPQTCPADMHTNCSNYGRCDGDNPLDGNQDSTGYPCKDQTGRTTDSNNDGIQDSAPQYQWNNTFNGSSVKTTLYDVWHCATPSMADHIQLNRDYYDNIQKPGYFSYAYPHPLARLSAPSDIRIQQ